MGVGFRESVFLPRSFRDKFSLQNCVIRKVTFSFFAMQGENKGKVVLHGVTGHVRSGEVTAVMGPSGAGKTTFLNTLSGKAYYGVSSSSLHFSHSSSHSSLHP
jgi:ABC-type multidrug transport system ATPase subunit